MSSINESDEGGELQAAFLPIIVKGEREEDVLGLDGGEGGSTPRAHSPVSSIRC